MTVTRTIAGRDLEFKEPKPAQITALRLFQQASAKKSKKLAADESVPLSDRMEGVQKLYDEFNIKSLNFLDSLLVNPDDADFLIDVQISGEYDISGLLQVVIHGETNKPDDDEDPKPAVARKAAPNPLKKAAAAKKTANARRTKK